MQDLILRRRLDPAQPEALQGAQLAHVRELLRGKRGVKFYQSPAWSRLRAEVLAGSHYECAVCAQRGKYTRAVCVHHVHHVEDHPELALALHYFSGGESFAQLVPLCHECHEDAHMHRVISRTDVQPLTPERW